MATTAPLPPAREIPNTFVSSFRSWWAAGEKQAATSEERILRRLPFFQPSPDHAPPTTSVIGRSTPIALSNPKRFINTFSIVPTQPSSASTPAPAVLLHGYGAGLGFFFRNFPVLGQWASKTGASVYALDWLGMGRSARPPFKINAKRHDIEGRVREAEGFFVDSLEEWRTQMGLEKMTLVGHSLGAYFSVVYALRYPNRVNRLVLLSPAGVPQDPNATMPSRELTDSQDTLTDASTNAGSAEPATEGHVDRLKNEQKVEKRQESKTRRLLTYLWEEGFSPFQVVRSTLFFGPMLIGKYSSRRFSELDEEETRDLHDYILNITLAKGSGEYCISHILAPGAHARLPLVDRIHELKIPVTFVYGDHDWMDPEGGAQSVENLRKTGNSQGRMYIIPHAGHHVYLDNPKAVNDLLIKELNRAK